MFLYQKIFIIILVRGRRYIAQRLCSPSPISFIGNKFYYYYYYYIIIINTDTNNNKLKLIIIKSLLLLF